MSLELKTIKEEIGVFEINYEELKKELSNEIAIYKNMIVSSETLGSAKEVKAKLNKLNKAINDWRIQKEKDFMKPFNEVKTQIRELNDMIAEAYNNINLQIKEFDEKEKKEKKEQIENIWNKKVNDTFPFILEEVFVDKWLNKTCNLATIEKEIDEIINTTYADYSFISNNFSLIEPLVKYYYSINGRNLQQAIEQAQAQLKAIQVEDTQTEKQENQSIEKSDNEEQTYTLTFKVVNVSRQKISKLDAFLKQENIQFELLK